MSPPSPNTARGRSSRTRLFFSGAPFSRSRSDNTTASANHAAEGGGRPSAAPTSSAVPPRPSAGGISDGDIKLDFNTSPPSAALSEQNRRASMDGYTTFRDAPSAAGSQRPGGPDVNQFPGGSGRSPGAAQAERSAGELMREELSRLAMLEEAPEDDEWLGGELLRAKTDGAANAERRARVRGITSGVDAGRPGSGGNRNPHAANERLGGAAAEESLWPVGAAAWNAGELPALFTHSMPFPPPQRLATFAAPLAQGGPGAEWGAFPEYGAMGGVSAAEARALNRCNSSGNKAGSPSDGVGNAGNVPLFPSISSKGSNSFVGSRRTSSSGGQRSMEQFEMQAGLISGTMGREQASKPPLQQQLPHLRQQPHPLQRLYPSAVAPQSAALPRNVAALRRPSSSSGTAPSSGGGFARATGGESSSSMSPDASSPDGDGGACDTDFLSAPIARSGPVAYGRVGLTARGGGAQPGAQRGPSALRLPAAGRNLPPALLQKLQSLQQLTQPSPAPPATGEPAYGAPAADVTTDAKPRTWDRLMPPAVPAAPTPPTAAAAQGDARSGSSVASSGSQAGCHSAEQELSDEGSNEGSTAAEPPSACLNWQGVESLCRDMELDRRPIESIDIIIPAPDMPGTTAPGAASSVVYGLRFAGTGEWQQPACEAHAGEELGEAWGSGAGGGAWGSSAAAEISSLKSDSLYQGRESMYQLTPMAA
ncbi:unnamed protein product [Closterium sp. Naga37s-1]|nr:unnamed protein product [Closterium sp. Naga37s-1]